MTGIVLAEGDGAPRLLPGAPNDYITGFVAAYGAMAALRAQLTVGGSWWVRASLCQTAAWIQRGGHLERPPGGAPEPAEADYVIEATAFGRLRYLRPPVTMTGTQPGWNLPPSPLGSHTAAWGGS